VLRLLAMAGSCNTVVGIFVGWALPRVHLRCPHLVAGNSQRLSPTALSNGTSWPVIAAVQ
jgi:hypothetical protein